MIGRAALLTICLLAGLAWGQEPETSRLERFREQVSHDLSNLPNYTCLETIARARRDAKARSFKATDTIRLEVTTVAGKEMFAWPGSHQFSDLELKDMVTNGAIGTGMFSAFAPHLFSGPSISWQYHGAEEVAGRAAMRYDYQLTPEQAALQIASSGNDETVGAKGSFWFDPVSLDLIRLEVDADHIPFDLHLEEAVFWTDYARVRLGDREVLLPKKSELIMMPFSGNGSRNTMDFSNCREYRSESTISFDAPSSEVQPAVKSTREVELPAGLLIIVELASGIDAKTSLVGDRLSGRVTQEIQSNGERLVPEGATATGHLSRIERGAGRSAIGIQLSDIEWPGAHATFFGELADIDRKSPGGQHVAAYYDGRRQTALIEKSIPGGGVFFVDGARFHFGAGLRLVWRTGAAH